jgi:hypothetical protein
MYSVKIACAMCILDAMCFIRMKRVIADLHYVKIAIFIVKKILFLNFTYFYTGNLFIPILQFFKVFLA